MRAHRKRSVSARLLGELEAGREALPLTPAYSGRGLCAALSLCSCGSLTPACSFLARLVSQRPGCSLRKPGGKKLAEFNRPRLLRSQSHGRKNKNAL